MGHVRAAKKEDAGRLLEVWLASVRATHHFLSAADIESLLPLVRDVVLPALEVWALCDDEGAVVGFMGLDGSCLEALFVDPAYLRRGGGRLLLEHARRLKGALTVSVNEQNPEALAFYLAHGFAVVGRSPLDGQGNPFPLLHLQDT